MTEEFYDEILKACGAISSIYFAPMPATSVIRTNGETKFIETRNTYCKMCAPDKISSRPSRQDARRGVNLIKISKFDL